MCLFHVLQNMGGKSMVIIKIFHLVQYILYTIFVCAMTRLEML